MSELLTQEELDALLHGIEEFESDEDLVLAEDTDSQADSHVKSYDFSRREKIIRGHLPFLDGVMGRFCSGFSKSLAHLLASPVEIDHSGLQVQRFFEFSQGWPQQTHFTIARLPPLHGRALIAIESNLVFSLIDQYFGSVGPITFQEDKKRLTPIMLKVLQVVLERLFKDLKEAWEPIIKLDVNYQSLERNPLFSSIAGPDEIVVISSITVKFTCGSGDLHVAMPYSMIEPISDLSENPGDGNSENDQLWQSAFRQQLLHSSMEVVGLLGQIELSLREVSQLKKGDIIPLDFPSRVLLTVEEVPIFFGKAGLFEGRLALQIDGRIET